MTSWSWRKSSPVLNITWFQVSSTNGMHIEKSGKHTGYSLSSSHTNVSRKGWRLLLKIPDFSVYCKVSYPYNISVSARISIPGNMRHTCFVGSRGNGREGILDRDPFGSPKIARSFSTFFARISFIARISFDNFDSVWMSSPCCLRTSLLWWPLGAYISKCLCYIPGILKYIQLPPK